MIRYIQPLGNIDIKDIYKVYIENLEYNSTIMNNINGLTNVSIERILMEVNKIVMHNNYLIGITMLNYYGISEYIFINKLDIHPLDQFNTLEERLSIIFNKVPKPPKQLGKGTTYLLQILNMEFNLITLCKLWHRNKSDYYSKFLIKYHSYILQNNTYLHLLDIDWVVNFNTSIYIGQDRTISDLTVKWLFLSNLPINTENIEQYKKNMI